jgi:hypothetical protein
MPETWSYQKLTIQQWENTTLRAIFLKVMIKGELHRYRHKILFRDFVVLALISTVGHLVLMNYTERLHEEVAVKV